jgi:cobalt/nickel transport system permease protein
VVAAAVCAIALGLSGTVPTMTALSAMVATHLPIALVEGLATAMVVALVSRPDTVAVRWPVVAACCACAMAPFASSLPDGLEHTAMQLGFAERATTHAAPFADYLVPGLPGVLAVIAAAAIGAFVVAALARYTPRSA